MSSSENPESQFAVNGKDEATERLEAGDDIDAVTGTADDFHPIAAAIDASRTLKARELLEAQAQRHAQTVKHLTSQLRGVERALQCAQNKFDAINEAIVLLAAQEGRPIL